MIRFSCLPLLFSHILVCLLSLFPLAHYQAVPLALLYPLVFPVLPMLYRFVVTCFSTTCTCSFLNKSTLSFTFNRHLLHPVFRSSIFHHTSHSINWYKFFCFFLGCSRHNLWAQHWHMKSIQQIVSYLCKQQINIKICSNLWSCLSFFFFGGHQFHQQNAVILSLYHQVWGEWTCCPVRHKLDTWCEMVAAHKVVFL